MDIVRLRTLTFKSIIGFGRYEYMSVQQIIDLQDASYLKWLYYNAEGISFTEDVLDYIKIFTFRRVKKPGKYPELWDDYIKLQEKTNQGVEGMVKTARHKKRLKAKVICSERMRSKYLTKRYMQSKNQGH